MREMRFEDLGQSDYEVKNATVLTWYWHSGDLADYTRTGRPDNILLFLLSGRREFRENGVCRAEQEAGTLCFIPAGHHYAGYVCASTEDSYGYVFQFDLQDANGEEILVNQPYYQVHDSEERGIYLLCQRLGDVNRAMRECSGLVKATFYELLSILSGDRERLAAADREYADIAPAVWRMRAFPEHYTSVRDLSELCRMSEASFRRRFARFSGGATPVEYRNRLLCEKAAQLYRMREYTLAQIAERLGFCDAAYMCRVYKRTMGMNFRDMMK